MLTCLVADPVGLDLLKSTVRLELCKSVIYLLGKLVVILLDSDSVVLIGILVIKNSKGIAVLAYKYGSGLEVDDNCIDLALLKSLNCISALVVTLNGSALNIGSIGIANCTKLNAYLLAVKVINGENGIFGSLASAAYEHCSGENCCSCYRY